MQNANLFTREDTFFGVCEGIGEDTGIPLNVLRVTLALLLFLYPMAVIVGYLAMGVVVAVSRWLFPKRRAAAGAPAVEAEAAAEASAEQLPLAA